MVIIKHNNNAVDIYLSDFEPLVPVLPRVFALITGKVTIDARRIL